MPASVHNFENIAAAVSAFIARPARGEADAGALTLMLLHPTETAVSNTGDRQKETSSLKGSSGLTRGR